MILAIVAAVFSRLAWWLSLDRLSAEERLLVGTWTFDGKSGTRLAQMRFGADRQYACGSCLPGGPITMIEWSGPWSVPNGAVVFDGERSAARRSLRGLGLPCNETYLPPYCDEVISDAAG